MAYEFDNDLKEEELEELEIITSYDNGEITAEERDRMIGNMRCNKVWKAAHDE